MIMLPVSNPSPYKLIFKANIFLLTQKKCVNTIINPVEANLLGFETWPDIIISIA